MEENEYDDLITLVEEKLRELGLGSLADSTNYAVEDLGTGERRLLPSRERLVDMLAAFGRHLASEDGSTVELALDRINKELVEGRVEDARFVPLADDRALAAESLSGAPGLRQLREELATLIIELRDGAGT